MAEAEATFPGEDAATRFARAANKTLRTWAFETERRAKMKSPVDTGFNKNSIYTVAPDGKLYSDQHEVDTRPPETIPTVNKKGKKVKPGQFADVAEQLGGGYQDVLANLGTGIQLIGGATHTGPANAPAEFSAEVRVGAEYALFLEMGTIHMQARPFLGPAAAEATEKLPSLLESNLAKEGLI